MPTNTAGSVGQRGYHNERLYLAKRVTFTTLGTNNTISVGWLPPRAAVIGGGTLIITGFNDTDGDDLDVGVTGSDDDLFASAVDMNTGGGVFTTLDDLATANRYSASAREVTCTLTTAATGDGTAGEAVVYIEYFVAP